MPVDGRWHVLDSGNWIGLVVCQLFQWVHLFGLAWNIVCRLKLNLESLFDSRRLSFPSKLTIKNILHFIGLYHSLVQAVCTLLFPPHDTCVAIDMT